MSTFIAWQKSSFSESQGSCVEIARHEGGIVMRESDDPEVVVRITTVRLRALIASVKSGGLIT
ncbi:DUF397 domain-containing protein [Streptomyces olivoreticuli]|uniref:DUF397 domain-containing protein n=1 Tax=Streptomyces olivoreticuli TaxID=68246 RepID=UPI00265B154C|nr:DUF397 domain-containing protein [Streptomyces olivoreticuli]WKK21026.1 DUF397 domain-containing protein [Streptomyces olivoreticuli]